MPTAGYDLFVADPGTETMYCRVCRTECDIKRDVFGPTSFATAMAKSFRLHDLFICPNADQQWHEQALRLVEKSRQRPANRSQD